MKKSNVIYFHPSNNFTGSTRVLVNQINEADGSSKYAYVVTKDTDNYGLLSRCIKIKIIRVFFPNKNKLIMKYIAPIISNIHIFIIGLKIGRYFNSFYINTLFPSSAAIAGRILRKNITFHIHEVQGQKGVRVKLKEFLFNSIIASRVFVSNYAQSQYGHISSNSTVQYNTLSKLFLSEVVITNVKERSLSEITLIASLSRHKGVFMFLDLAQQLPEYHFNMVLSTTQDNIDKNFKNVSSNLTIMPTQTNIHPILKKTDLLLNLTDPNFMIETFGMTIIEAMAYGIPSIVPNVGGPIEIVQNGVNGFCADVTNIEDLKKHIRHILSRSKYASFHENALFHAETYMAKGKM